VHDRSAPGGIDQVERGGQRLPVDRDALRRVLRRVAIARDHRGHRLAREASLRPGQDGLVGHHVAGQRGAGLDALPGKVGVGAGRHRGHPRQGEGRRGVDGPQPRVGVGAAHEGHVEHARQLHVGHVAALAGEEPRVFFSRLGRAEGAAVRRAGRLVHAGPIG